MDLQSQEISNKQGIEIFALQLLARHAIPGLYLSSWGTHISSGESQGKL